MYKTKPNQNECEKLTNIPNYLIIIEKDGKLNEIIPCCSISKVLEIVRCEKKIVTIFEKAGTAAGHWRYLCDMSAGVI